MESTTCLVPHQSSLSVRGLVLAIVSSLFFVPSLVTFKFLHFALKLIAIPCERCDVERRDFGFGDGDVFAPLPQETSKEPVATEDIGVMTDHSIIEPLSFPATAASAPTAAGGHALSRTSSASSMSHLTGNVRLCDKCSCTIESVAKDFIDQNLDQLVAEVGHEPPVPTLQSRIPKLSHSRGPRAPPRRVKAGPLESVARGGLRKDLTPASSATAPSVPSLDEQPILAGQTGTTIPEPVERAPGEKRGTSDGFVSDHCLSLDSSFVDSTDSYSADSETEDEFVPVGRIICHVPPAAVGRSTIVLQDDQETALISSLRQQSSCSAAVGQTVDCSFLAVDPAGSLVLCGARSSASGRSSSGCTGSGSSVESQWEAGHQQPLRERADEAADRISTKAGQDGRVDSSPRETPKHAKVSERRRPAVAGQLPTVPAGGKAAAQLRGLSRQMESACFILNEYLQRPEKSDPNKLKTAMSNIQTEWFAISSRPDTDPAQVQDILEELDRMSNHLLHRVVNMADTNGNTALHYAVSHGNFPVVTRLLDSRATDVNKQNRAGYTAVMLAALASIGSNETQQRATVHRLFQMGDVNAKASQNGQTALMLAASHGRVDMVKALLEAGADPNMQDNDGSTGLMCAAEHGYIDVVRMLLANPDVEINIADHDGHTALSIAMEAGHKDTALLIYASSNFSRGSSPYSSLRGRKSRISPRATPPPSRPSRTPPPPGPSRPSRTPPPPSPSRSRKGSTSSVSSFSRAWF